MCRAFTVGPSLAIHPACLGLALLAACGDSKSAVTVTDETPLYDIAYSASGVSVYAVIEHEVERGDLGGTSSTRFEIWPYEGDATVELVAWDLETCGASSAFPLGRQGTSGTVRDLGATATLTDDEDHALVLQRQGSRYGHTWFLGEVQPWTYHDAWFDLTDGDGAAVLDDALGVPDEQLSVSAPALEESVNGDDDLTVRWNPGLGTGQVLIEIDPPSGGSFACATADDGELVLSGADLGALATGESQLSVHRMHAWALERDGGLAHLYVHDVVRQALFLE